MPRRFRRTRRCRARLRRPRARGAAARCKRGSRRDRDLALIGEAALRRQPVAGFERAAGDLDGDGIGKLQIFELGHYCTESNVSLAPRIVSDHLNLISPLIALRCASNRRQKGAIAALRGASAVSLAARKQRRRPMTTISLSTLRLRDPIGDETGAQPPSIRQSAGKLHRKFGCRRPRLRNVVMGLLRCFRAASDTADAPLQSSDCTFLDVRLLAPPQCNQGA